MLINPEYYSRYSRFGKSLKLKLPEDDKKIKENDEVIVFEEKLVEKEDTEKE